ERHERDHAGALDRDAHLALMRGAVAADATRNDLAAIGDEVLQRLRILVVDGDVLVGAEAADLATGEATLARVLALLVLVAASTTTAALLVRIALGHHGLFLSALEREIVVQRRQEVVVEVRNVLFLEARQLRSARGQLLLVGNRR